MPSVPSHGPVSGLKGRLFAAIVGASLAAPGPAQDLATLAKQERERRAKAAQEGKTYSDGNAGGEPAKPGTVPKGSPTPPRAQTAPPPAPDAQRPAWKARADQSRASITQAEAGLKAIDVQIAAQHSDTAPLSAAEARDPMRLHKREARVRELIAQREAQKEILANAKKALEVLEQEARRNGVPAGWLR